MPSDDEQDIEDRATQQHTEEIQTVVKTKKEKIKEICKGHYFEVDILQGPELRNLFPSKSRFSDSDNNYWTVNRNLWFCHHCGASGFKYGRVNVLSKCYACHSHNITIIKSGEISIILRELKAGINMEEVRCARREWIKSQKKK